MEIPLSFPLDSERFLRRECPFCAREFKVLLHEREIVDLTQMTRDRFLLAEGGDTRSEDDTDDTAAEHHCPYCGQSAPPDHWWTTEQVAYIHVVVHNVAARLINENLIRPLKRSFRAGRSSGPISIRVQADEMREQEPWISPETDDMQPRELPCCDRSLKLLDDWAGRFHCFFCGFPYDHT